MQHLQHLFLYQFELNFLQVLIGSDQTTPILPPNRLQKWHENRVEIFQFRHNPPPYVPESLKHDRAKSLNEQNHDIPQPDG